MLVGSWGESKSIRWDVGVVSERRLAQLSYNNLGDIHLRELNNNHLARNLVHRLERLGYSVTLTPQRIAV